MHIYIYIPMSLEVLGEKINKYKEREREKWVIIYDKSSHPEWFTNKESFSLLYSEEDWLWFSKIIATSEDEIKMFFRNWIDLELYSSSMFFTINRENFQKWYDRIKDFIDFIWGDYIALWESMQSVFDFEKWFIQELL